ncbi:D-alanyl-lipoteichoic acid biosynthesis protein DltB [Macrococcoides canis]|uniref:D-alanyl-lipoteichoic acid biosynthesis protein DltB n=1 Tax=Macrococcoides canis TaxID=1855823 RepID=UPI001B8C6D4B|nr:D-alanyl-lipoteichoic acid biosynthesis protein DltB [Macrococcus canis]QUR93926.1 D-alanyl-lipoteichoic acid biosynthesis protein DltB [Macrococcus canis]UTH07550.1 D-alanyl-lipoteichoic acid biosynthesis protein DltB [Macrococcus canis]
MIPYGDFPFFFIALALLLPVVILGLLGKRNEYYNWFVTIIMLVLIFKDPNENFLGISILSYEFVSFVMYVTYQIILIKSYVSIVKRKNTLSLFVTFLILSILPLAAVKVIQSSLFGLNGHTDTFSIKSLIGFLGISYIMFKCIQIIMEIRDKRIKEIHVIEVIKFLTFFPTISSGPIDRFKRFNKDVIKGFTKEKYTELLNKAIHYIFIGFLYKYIIAYYINQKVILNINFDSADIWMKIFYMYAYSFYLFFDFAGYSLFAVAFSYIMGIETPPNFNQPFIAKNIKDFWNRWHMSLSFWFRDMVYMRFVFFITKNKYIKNNFTTSNIGFMLNFLIMGIWHGIEWFYIAYGLYHGILFVLYGYYEQYRKKHPYTLPAKVVDTFGIIITFHVVAFGFLIFSGKLF